MLSKDEVFKASAPGSLMLLGEYAVLYNKPALVCAIDKRIKVTLRPRSDDQVIIQSDRYGSYNSRLQDLRVEPPFHFITACLRSYRKKMNSGCMLEINSEFSDQIGLGSSAALTVATLAAVQAWLKIPRDQVQLIRIARSLIREVQTLGSGADAAASVVGGIVAYSPRPLAFEQFILAPALTVIYSGFKTPTVEAIQRVQKHFSAAPALLKVLCQAIHQCVREGVQALRQQNWQHLGTVMNVQQGLMQALGVSTPLLDDLIERLRVVSSIYGAKITGSGWGDCVLGLGKAEHLGLEERYNGVRQIEMKVAQEGVLVQ